MEDALFDMGRSPEVDRLVEELWKTPGWPRDAARDRAFVAELVRQYPRLNLPDEFGKWRVWLIANGTGKEVKSRGRFTRLRYWCSRAGRTSAGTGRAQRGGRTTARPVDAFGRESSTSFERW